MLSLIPSLKAAMPVPFTCACVIILSGGKASRFYQEFVRPGKAAALEVFGAKRRPGTLVVDRYAGYNKVGCAIQYCYAHLLREVQDLGKEFAQQAEVQRFVETLAPLSRSCCWKLRRQRGR